MLTIRANVYNAILNMKPVLSKVHNMYQHVGITRLDRSSIIVSAISGTQYVEKIFDGTMDIDDAPIFLNPFKLKKTNSKVTTLTFEQQDDGILVRQYKGAECVSEEQIASPKIAPKEFFRCAQMMSEPDDDVPTFSISPDLMRDILEQFIHKKADGTCNAVKVKVAHNKLYLETVTEKGILMLVRT